MADLIDIGLVDLISQQHQLLLSCELYQIPEVLVAQALASGIAWIDEDKSADCKAVLAAQAYRLPQIFYACTPILLLLQVVAKQRAPCNQAQMSLS